MIDLATYKQAQLIALQLHPPKSDLDDLVQDAVIRIWTVRERWNPRRASWATFSQRVMRREMQSRLRTAHRTKERRPPHGPITYDIAEDFRFARSGRVRSVRGGQFPRYSPDQRAAALAAVRAGEPVKVVAIRFGISRQTLWRWVKKSNDAR